MLMFGGSSPDIFLDWRGSERQDDLRFIMLPYIWKLCNDTKELWTFQFEKITL